MSVIVGHARFDEHRRFSGGLYGDNASGNDQELILEEWYTRNWDYVLRPIKTQHKILIAKYMKNACLNENIGYDQGARGSIGSGGVMDPGEITYLCACDCSSLLEYICAAAGILSSFTGNMYTSNEIDYLLNTGCFEKYEVWNKTNSQLKEFVIAGDILLFNHRGTGSGHTAVVVTTSAVNSDGLEGVCLNIEQGTSTVQLGVPYGGETDTYTNYLSVAFKNRRERKIQYIRDVYYYTNGTFVQIGKRATDSLAVWDGWTRFESTFDHDDVRALYRTGDGSKFGEAYGIYMFDYRYALVPFMKSCVQSVNRTRYIGFQRFLNIEPGSLELRVRAQEIYDLFKYYAEHYTEDFRRLQDDYYYSQYLLPAINIAQSMNLPNLDDPYVKGTLGSMAIRDGAYVKSTCGLAIKAMADSGERQILKMLKVGYDYFHEKYSKRDKDYRWSWDGATPWGPGQAQGVTLQTQYAEQSHCSRIESMVTCVAETSIDVSDVTFVGDYRTAIMGKLGIKQYDMLDNDNICAVVGKDLISYGSVKLCAYKAGLQNKKKVVFWLGNNDILDKDNLNTTTFLDNYKTIISEYLKGGGEGAIYIASILPPAKGDPSWYEEIYRVATLYNITLKEYCKNNYYNFIDLSSYFTNKDYDGTFDFNRKWYLYKFRSRMKLILGINWGISHSTTTR